MLLNWRKQLYLWSYILLICGVVRAIFFYLHLQTPLGLIGDNNQPYYLIVSSGDSLSRISQRLLDAGADIHTFDLAIYARARGLASNIKTGEYEINPAMTPVELLDNMVQGKVLQRQVVILEGWTLRQAINTIQASPYIETTFSANDRSFISELFETDYYPEGLFFPDTYLFTTGTTDQEILLRGRRMMQETLDEAWQVRDVGLPYESPYQVIVMASIVEKETGLTAERERIAGVFIRRLQQNMRLQADPTVIYGLGDGFDGNLTRNALRTPTPYNTYTNRGLPVTPIALPGRDSIFASVQPDQSQNLYFVARGDGSHHFSETLEEHNQAVRQYQLQ